MIDKAMFQLRVKKSGNYSSKTFERIMKFGGLKTVLKKLDENETIKNVAFVLYDCDDSAVVSIFMSNDLSVITDRRIFIFQSRLLGTLIKEIPLKSIESITYNSSDWGPGPLRINVNTFGKAYSWLVLGTDEEKCEAQSAYYDIVSR